MDRHAHDRSMKAGAFTPAIPDLLVLVPQLLRRSMKAGAFTPAIQRVVAHVILED